MCSVYTTLLLAYFCGGGEAEKELKQILLLLDGAESSKTDVEYSYKFKNERSNRFQNQSIEYISVDNKLYILKSMVISVSEKKSF